MTEDATWQITLHDGPEEMPFVGTFFAGTPEQAFRFALALRPVSRPVWIRIEHIPCIVIVQ